MPKRFRGFLVVLPCLALAIACQKSEALMPTLPTPTPEPPAGGATLKVTAPKLIAPINDTRLESFTAPTLHADSVDSTHGVSLAAQYRFQLLNEAGALLQDSGLRATTTWTPTIRIDFDRRYLWQVRAEWEGETGPWSNRASFLSARGSFQRGQEIFDMLTDGRTVGTRYGGTFVPGQGWQATGHADGIDYDIPTCTECTVEFDVTDFGKGEGRGIQKDLKWLSMGDGSAFSNFGAFRNHPWKMHLEQRSDFDGTGMKLIWRNGRAGGGDPGDHDAKLKTTSVMFRKGAIFHFTVSWTPNRYEVAVGETQADGSVSGNQVWFSGSFARPFAPPNHRISVGTRSRSETLMAVYRNVRIYPGSPRPSLAD